MAGTPAAIIFELKAALARPSEKAKIPRARHYLQIRATGSTS
jgi:hypothetical protein